MSPVVEHLHSKCQILSSKHSTARKTTKRIKKLSREIIAENF
jgi:hypothetical protein